MRRRFKTLFNWQRIHLINWSVKFSVTKILSLPVFLPFSFPLFLFNFFFSTSKSKFLSSIHFVISDSNQFPSISELSLCKIIFSVCRYNPITESFFFASVTLDKNHGMCSYNCGLLLFCMFTYWRFLGCFQVLIFILFGLVGFWLM